MQGTMKSIMQSIGNACLCACSVLVARSFNLGKSSSSLMSNMVQKFDSNISEIMVN